ncbi:MAG: DUF1521 domain-containing protein [Gaiellales bacterium]
MTSTAPISAPPLPGTSSGLPPSLPPGFNTPATTTPPATAGTATTFVAETTAGGSEFKTLPAPGTATSPAMKTDPMQKGATGGGDSELASVLTSLTGVLGQLTTLVGGISGGGAGAPGKDPSQVGGAAGAPGKDPTQVAGADGGGVPVQQSPAQKSDCPHNPATVAGANGGGAANALQGADQVQGGGAAAPEMTAIVQALQSLVEVLGQLVQLLATQNGGVEGGGPGKAPGKVGGDNGGPVQQSPVQQTPPGKVDGEKGGPVQQAPVKQAPPAKVGGEKGGPVKQAPVKQAPPAKVGGEKGGPVQQSPVQQTPPAKVGGENGGPVQQSPVQQTPPSKVDGAKGSPVQQSPVQQSPVQQTPPSKVSGENGGPKKADPKAKLGTVKLDNVDKRWNAKLHAPDTKGGANSVEIWGDPHVVIMADGKAEKFDIGHGAGKVTLFDGTKISWDTYDKGEKHKIQKDRKSVEYILSDFKVDSKGTNLDRSVTTRDYDGSKGDQLGLTTALTEAHLKEFAIALRSMEGSWKSPLKNDTWVSPAFQKPTQVGQVGQVGQTGKK